MVGEKEKKKREIGIKDDKRLGITNDNDKMSSTREKKKSGSEKKTTEKIVFENILKPLLLVYEKKIRIENISITNLL